MAPDGRTLVIGGTTWKTGYLSVWSLDGAPTNTTSELHLGPPVGTKVPGSFPVLIISHPETPSAAGKKWDYVEQHGQAPVVLVFARTSSDPLTKLLQRLDAELAQLRAANKRGHAALVMLTDGAGPDEMLKALAERHGFKHVSLSIGDVAGPPNWRIAKDADVTVILYRRQQIEASHAFQKGRLDEKEIDSVMADLSKIITK
jgi:hypothetical protein